MNEAKEKIKDAFERAGFFSELKKNIKKNIDRISEYLEEVSGGNIELFYKKIDLTGYSATDGVFIKHKHDYSEKEMIFIFAFMIDDAKGYPVLLENDTSANYVETEDLLITKLVELITNDEIMARTYNLIERKNEEFKDFPF